MVKIDIIETMNSIMMIIGLCMLRAVVHPKNWHFLFSVIKLGVLNSFHYI